MALERTVLMADGSVRSHHEIERITHVCGYATTIDVLSWTDSTRSGDYVRTFVTRDYDSSITESDAYTIVSADEAFVEYIDPNKEAIDTLLPILTDEQAEAVTGMYPEWEADISYAVGERIKYNSKLYRCVQAHTSQIGWEPPVTTALWVRTVPDGDIPDWVQPTGAQDAYGLGDKVKHNGSIWVSDIGANVWEPGIYGWTASNE